MYDSLDDAWPLLANIKLTKLIPVNVRVICFQHQSPRIAVEVFSIFNELHGVVLVAAMATLVVAKMVTVNQLLHGELVQHASLDSACAFDRRDG